MLFRAKYQGEDNEGRAQFVLTGEDAVRTAQNLGYPPGLRRELEKGETIYLGKVNNSASDWVLVALNKLELDKIKDVHIENAEASVRIKEGGEVELKGNNHGGLVRWPELEEQLGKLNALWDAVQGVLDAEVVEPGNGAPSVFHKGLKAALSQLQTPDYSEVESADVLHGDKVEAE